MPEAEIAKIKGIVEELLRNMTVIIFNIEVTLVANKGTSPEHAKDVVNIDINIEEPQVLIGQNGQTLLEVQRLVRIMVNKKLQKDFYINLDINDYKKKKVDYLKQIAKDAADQVIATGENKTLPPMPAYERRIIHAELSLRQDVATASQGEGIDRCVVVRPK